MRKKLKKKINYEKEINKELQKIFNHNWQINGWWLLPNPVLNYFRPRDFVKLKGKILLKFVKGEKDERKK